MNTILIKTNKFQNKLPLTLRKQSYIKCGIGLTSYESYITLMSVKMWFPRKIQRISGRQNNKRGSPSRNSFFFLQNNTYHMKIPLTFCEHYTYIIHNMCCFFSLAPKCLLTGVYSSSIYAESSNFINLF